MGQGQHAGHLGAVYSAQAPEEIARAYDAWADSYDAEMARAGYRHPAVGAGLLARHVPRGAGPILDAGCGTGLLGEWLGILGLGPLHGLDLSEGMLARARARGAYATLTRAALGGPLPWADGAFAATICTGVFTTGHVGAEGLAELARVTRPGGALVLTVKETLWPAFAAAIAADPRLRLAEETGPYISMPGEEGTIPSRALVLARREEERG
jgi:predicted TPR repeat methyltransferase